MKLTQERIARYLKKQKQTNDYLLKVTSKNRKGLILLSRARALLLEGETELRKLNEYLTRGGKDNG
jgi:hypothetical protein